MATQGTTVIVTQPGIFGEGPVQTTCPNCNSSVVTTITKENGTFAYLLAILVCLIFCPCFWIPLVIDGTKDTSHSCPNCNVKLGTHKRM